MHWRNNRFSYVICEGHSLQPTISTHTICSYLMRDYLIWMMWIIASISHFIVILQAHFFFEGFIATLFIYLFIFGCVGSSVRARAFSGYGKWGPLFLAVRGPLFIAVRGPFTIAAPPVAGHRLQTRRLSSCGSRAQPLRGMWDPPRPGLEPMSPALAGGFLSTAPPGKPENDIFLMSLSKPHLF